MTIEQLVNKYKLERDYYLTDKYNETLLRSDFLDPLFELLGWDIKNIASKPTNEREVILEESLKTNAAEHSKKPDYTFRLFSERKFFLEAKKPCVSIDTNSDTAKQVRRYGFTAKLKISVLSNFEYLIIYDTSIKVEKDDEFTKAIVKKYHYTEYESKFEEIKMLLGKEAVYSGAFETEWKDIETKLNQYSIDNLFLNQINEWRKLLGAEIYKYEPRIKEHQLNDIVQSYLNRILFLRVCEDRNLEEYQTLLKFANLNDFKSLINKFEQADKRYDSGLFDQLLKDQIIENVSSVFWVIIKQLYYPESPYSFSVFSSNVLGSIYEIFLSEKLIIENGTIKLVKKPENIDRDIITTPTFIINDILRNTVLPKCEGKTDKEILNLKFADISCGSGAFLLELFQVLNDVLIDYYLKENKSKLIQTNINTYKLPFKIKREFLINCIFGIDKDFNAVEATKFGLLLKLLENEDLVSTSTAKPILPNLEKNIFYGNSLLSPKQVIDKENQFAINPFDFSSFHFDVIVGNPPYMKSEDMKNITPLELELYKTNYISAYKQFDKYFLFIEQGLNLLTSDGILGYIVPSKFTRVGAGKKLREILQNSKNISQIISFGANQIFKNKTTYTCLLFLRKSTQEVFKYFEVENLNEWKIRDFSKTDFEQIKTISLNSEGWILISAKLKKVFKQILDRSIPLGDLVGEENIFNGIQTSANKIYIHKQKNENKMYYFFEKDEIEWKIEKELTRPYFQTSSGFDNLYTYRKFQPNSFVIYPYKKTEHGIEFIKIQDLKNNFPYAFKYLSYYKNDLNNPRRDIKPEPQTKNEWYRYGRHQSLDKCEVPAKIVVGILSLGDKYAIDYHQTVLSSGGNAGYCIISIPQNSLYSIYYIQALLNSKYVEWFCSLFGSIFRGGYISHGTQVLKRLPIIKIDFKNEREKKTHDQISKFQKELIEIQTEIDNNENNNRLKTPHQRKFKDTKNCLDKLLKELYQLKEDDDLIPIISRNYEAD